MSSLNKKNGNLRGVSLNYAPLDPESGDRDYSSDWVTGVPVQGWTVFNNEKHRFDINFRQADYDIEILFTAEALENMLLAIRANQEPIAVDFTGCCECGGQ